MRNAIETRDRILRVALGLVDREGISALTTRAVCDGAKITPPTLYHHFKGKDGLQRAVVQHVIDEFLKTKRAVPRSRDAAVDLKRGWSGWIGFALQHPNQFRLMIETARTDPTVSRGGYDLLMSIIERLSAEGRLRTDVETATRTVWAAANGVLSLFLQGESVEHISVVSALLIESLIGRLVEPLSNHRALVKSP
jgi:AcrR family transcriptional regulator